MFQEGSDELGGFGGGSVFEVSSIIFNVQTPLFDHNY